MGNVFDGVDHRIEAAKHLVAVDDHLLKWAGDTPVRVQAATVHALLEIADRLDHTGPGTVYDYVEVRNDDNLASVIFQAMMHSSIDDDHQAVVQNINFDNVARIVRSYLD